MKIRGRDKRTINFITVSVNTRNNRIVNIEYNNKNALRSGSVNGDPVEVFDIYREELEYDKELRKLWRIHFGL